MEQFRIDPEFQNKIPPIGEDEFRQLRENILASGEVYEPLVVWNGVLVDGHNRWKVIQENPSIRYKVRQMDFPDKWAAFEWMYKNQLGRRNLTDEQRTYTIGKMKEARKQSVGAPAENKNAQKQMHQNGVIVSDDHKHGTASAIAFELGIGRNTVDRAERFAKGVDALREVSPAAADKVLSGKADITKSEVQEIAKMQPGEVQEAADKILNPRREEPKQNVQKPKNKGRTKADRELMNAIKSAISAQTDIEGCANYDIDDLIKDIEVNGENYVNSLRNMLTIRRELLSDAEAKNRVFKAIAVIIQDISKTRGEFVK